MDLEGNRLHVADLDNSASKRDLEKVKPVIICHLFFFGGGGG